MNYNLNAQPQMRSLRRNQRGRCSSCFAASAQPIKYEPIDVKLIVQLQLRPQLQLQLQRLPWSCVCALLSSSSGSIGSRAHKVQTLSSTLPASQHILPPFKEVAPPHHLLLSPNLAAFQLAYRSFYTLPAMRAMPQNSLRLAY